MFKTYKTVNYFISRNQLANFHRFYNLIYYLRVCTVHSEWFVGILNNGNFFNNEKFLETARIHFVVVA